MSENREDFGKSMEIDLVDFSANKEMDIIRENERIEREKRRRRVEQERRAEMRRRRQIERIKQAVIAWTLLIVCVVAVVFLVIGIVSLFNGGSDEGEKAPVAGDVISEKETELISNFRTSGNTVYGDGKKAVALQNMLSTAVVEASNNEGFVTHTSEFSMLADAYSWNSGFGKIEDVKNYIRSCPISNMGYVYSSPVEVPEKMRSPVTKGYLYDTQAAFINAVYEVCKWEGNASFVDASVLSDLERVAGHYMNKTDLNGGGIRYNFRYYTENGKIETEDTNDALVYICTDGNLGTPESNASNIFLAYKFGYLDCYNNLVFYDAMVSMSKIYDMKLKELEALDVRTADDEVNIAKYKEKRDEYISYAEANKEAINNTFYDKEKGRYIGYIGVDGQKYDYGFTAINLMAISLGVADEEKTNSIMSWINGERKISGDKITGKDISSGTFPVFSTVEVSGDSSWNTLGIYLRDSGFGSLWLYGGQSAFAGYWNVEANKALGREEARSNVQRLVGACENGLVRLPDAENKANEPSLHYALAVSTAVKEYFGVSVDDDTLVVNPSFSSGDNIGIKNIYFRKNHCDVLFNDSDVYVVLEEKQATKLRIGGFSPKSSVRMTIVDSGKVSSVKELVADGNGFVSIIEKFGDTSYIKLER